MVHVTYYAFYICNMFGPLHVNYSITAFWSRGGNFEFAFSPSQTLNAWCFEWNTTNTRPTSVNRAHTPPTVIPYSDGTNYVKICADNDHALVNAGDSQYFTFVASTSGDEYDLDKLPDTIIMNHDPCITPTPTDSPKKESEIIPFEINTAFIIQVVIILFILAVAIWAIGQWIDSSAINSIVFQIAFTTFGIFRDIEFLAWLHESDHVAKFYFVLFTIIISMFLNVLTMAHLLKIEIQSTAFSVWFHRNSEVLTISCFFGFFGLDCLSLICSGMFHLEATEAPCSTKFIRKLKSAYIISLLFHTLPQGFIQYTAQTLHDSSIVVFCFIFTIVQLLYGLLKASLWYGLLKFRHGDTDTTILEFQSGRTVSTEKGLERSLLNGVSIPTGPPSLVGSLPISVGSTYTSGDES